MQGGKLHHRVRIERPGVPTPDGMGGTTAAQPVIVATVWASVEGLTARERDQARAIESERTHRVTMRYRTDIDEACYLRHGDRCFRITGVVDLDGRRRDLDIACTEIGNETGARHGR